MVLTKLAVPGRPRLVAEGPRVRLGLLWLLVALVTVILGPVACGVVFGLLALAAAGQSTRAWRRQRRRPHRPVAAGGATVIAFAAGFGTVPMVVAAACAGGASVLASRVARPERPPDAALTAAIALVAGIAAGTVPLARAEIGFTATAVLLLFVFVSDATWYLIGTGSRFRLEAPLAAMAAIAVTTTAVAATLVPPFRGASPWVLGAIAAVLIPLGPRLASAVLPDPDAFAPALRRIDGFAMVGPVWVLVAAALLDLR